MRPIASCRIVRRSLPRTAAPPAFVLTAFASLAIAGCFAAPKTAPAQSGSQALPVQAGAQDTLQIINEPGGAQVVYGTIDSQHTPQNAMAFLLKQVHGHYGDKPAVSSIFQIKNTTSYGAFFTLIAKNAGNAPIAGEVIVNMPAGSQPIAAILTDNAATFTRSQPVMLKALDNAWHTANPIPAATATAAAPAASTAVPPLNRVTGGDRSVYISLPAGWKLDSVAGGSVSAEGPKGERLGLNLMVQGIVNSRAAMPGRVAYPFGGDLFTAYINILNQTRANQHLPAVTAHLNSSTPLAGGAVQVAFDVDLHDNLGVRAATARVAELGQLGSPTWAMSISNSSLPKTIAAAENATLLAVIQSASQDPNVVKAEQGAVMQRIQAAGARANENAQAADQRRVASAQAFDASMDNIDSQSKAMQNYTLDRTQIQDNDANGRATVSNGLADALVKSDPTRYQVVPPSQFLKGADY